MEEFDTQVCTTPEQTRKLISLGIKKETADVDFDCLTGEIRHLEEPYEDCGITIPAWSLNRLIKMGFHKGIGIVVADNAFDSIISLIEKRIKAGVFNKEYLCDSKEV